MKVLMIAPQPFFEPRGAPFCVYHYLRALSALGHEVDLVTYPFGSAVELPNVRIYRAPTLPFLSGVKPGFSLAKIPLDLLLFLIAFWQMFRRKYHALHTHEEGALMGIVLAMIFRCKHLYYMHCDLSELLCQHPLVAWAIKAVQRFMVRRADAVVAFYPALVITARKMAPNTPIHLILPPAVDEELPEPSKEAVGNLRQRWELGDAPILLYTGTLERYQGLDLLLHSAAIVYEHYPATRYLIVGGKPDQVASLRQLARQIGVEHMICFTGQRPLAEMPAYMALADILLSPRNGGTHTPLKLYTYLRSGKPLLATRVRSQTQILDSDIALLVAPTPEALAEGILELLGRPVWARELGAYAQRFALQHYSWPVFLEQCRELYTAFAELAR